MLRSGRQSHPLASRAPELSGTAKALSATMTICLPGNHRLTCLIIWRAQTRAAHGMGTSSIMHSQRNPLTLTKWLREERTGSR